MSADRAERLYELQVKALSPNERLRLLASSLAIWRLRP
jgi:hypothetical protein